MRMKEATRAFSSDGREGSEGMTSVTQKEVARRLGLSQSTVSMVLNDDPRVAKETSSRVLGMMEELDYRPDAIARSFMSEETGIVGFILCDVMVSRPVYGRMLEGVDQAVRRGGGKLLFSSAQEYLSEKREFPSILKERVLDGAIVSGKVSREFVDVLRSRRLPLVLLGTYDIEDADTVTADNRKGAFDAVSYLVSLGHSRIAFIADTMEYPAHRERSEGYRMALEKAGLDREGFLLLGKEEGAAPTVDRILDIGRDGRPTAMLACNDMVAMTAMEQLKERGQSVPDDMSIVGFDDDRIGSHVTPRLTTVRVFEERLGERAAGRLAEVIGGGSEAPVREVMDTELIIRESCGVCTR